MLLRELGISGPYRSAWKTLPGAQQLFEAPMASPEVGVVFDLWPPTSLRSAVCGL